MKYFVTVAGQEFEIEIEGDRIVVDGRPVTAALDPVPGTPLRHLVIDGRPVELAVEAAGRGTWTFIHRGDRREIEVVDERTRHIRSLAADPAVTAGVGVVRAPMPGLVVRVEASPGQQVPAGAGLVVLEAMKMENELRAPAAAVVRAVLVEPGQAVEKGQVLVELDASP